MTALALPSLASLAAGVEIDDLAHALACFVETGIPQMDLRGAFASARQLEHYADGLRRCSRAAAEIERAEQLLGAAAIEAKRHAGQLLAELDAGAKGSRKPSDRRVAAEEAGIERTAASQLVKLAAIPDEQVAQIAATLDAAGSRITIGGVLKAAKQESVLIPGTTRDDCFTEPGLFVAVRGALGEIDSDLTSCLTAQGWIRARAWWSLRSPHDEAEQANARAAWTAMGWSEAEQVEAIAYSIKTWRGIGGLKDGRLTQKPAGTTWGQPPYSAPDATIYTITDGYRQKMVTAAIILLNTATSTEVQQHLLRLSSARLWISKGEDHPRTRMAFYRPNGIQQRGNDRDQVAYYLGEEPTTFAEHFAGWGVVKIG